MRLRINIEAMKENIARREEILAALAEGCREEDALLEEIAQAKEEVEFMQYAVHRYEMIEEKNRQIVNKLDWKGMLYGENETSSAAFEATRTVGN